MELGQDPQQGNFSTSAEADCGQVPLHACPLPMTETAAQRPKLNYPRQSRGLTSLS